MDPQNLNQPPVPPQQPVQPPISPQPPIAPPLAVQQPVQPAMQQPVQPFQPATPAPYGGYSPQPAGSGPSKKLIMGIIGGVVGLLLIIIIAVVAVSSMGVSKADYKDASEKMQDVKTAYNKIGSVYLSSSSSDAEVKNGLDTIKEAREEFATEFDGLKDMKAIKNDKDVNKLYKEVVAKQPDFDKAMDATLEAYDKIYPAVKDVGFYSSSESSKIAALKSKFEAIDGLKDGNNKEFVEKMTSLLGKYSALAKKVEAGRDDYRKYDAQASRDFYDTSTQLRNTVRDWQSNITKLADDGEIRDQLKALDDELFDKISDSK